MVFAREKIKSQIIEALDRHNCADVCLHTDVSTIGIPEPMARGRAGIAQAWLSIFEEVAVGRLLRFPTFNYDYCRARVYNVLEDPCQVGALNEFVRLAHPETRTHTPVFNFCSLGEHQRQGIKGVVNPFGPGSTFDELVHASGWSACLGVNLSVYTLVHYVEELMNIGYRYYKAFPGVLQTPNGSSQINFTFRVHPPNDYSVAYDTQRLDDDLCARGLLFRHEVGLGYLVLRDAKKACDYWCERMAEDPFFLLTEEAKDKIAALSRVCGYPFTFESVEGSASPSEGLC